MCYYTAHTVTYYPPDYLFYAFFAGQLEIVCLGPPWRPCTGRIRKKPELTICGIMLISGLAQGHINFTILDVFPSANLRQKIILSIIKLPQTIASSPRHGTFIFLYLLVSLILLPFLPVAKKLIKATKRFQPAIPSRLVYKGTWRLNFARQKMIYACIGVIHANKLILLILAKRLLLMWDQLY